MAKFSKDNWLGFCLKPKQVLNQGLVEQQNITQQKQ